MTDDDHRVKVFMTEDALAELEDRYDENPEDLRKIVRDKIRELVKSAKMAKIQKIIIANIENEVTKANKQENFPLKDFKLEKYDLKSDSDWLPKDFEEDETKFYSVKVGANTWKYLCWQHNRCHNSWRKSRRKNERRCCSIFTQRHSHPMEKCC